MHWPAGIRTKGGETRSQFTHVIDVAPTILEVAKLPEPTFVNGVQQSPIEGTSMVYTFDDAEVAERHDLQYFEMAGNRGIYYKGWSAVTRHSTPWLFAEALPPALDDDVWELYDGSQDWTQSKDLAAELPEKLAALQRLWLIEAVKYNVLPIDDRRFERFNPHIAGASAVGVRESTGSVSRNETAERAQRAEYQEPIIQCHSSSRRRGWHYCQRCDDRAGRQIWWLGTLRAGRPRQIRLQPIGHDRVRHRFRR